MLGPSGVLTGQIRPYWDECMSRIENDARSRDTPPVPITVSLLKLSISDKGFVWSTIVESWLTRKNSLIEAIRGFGLISWLGDKSATAPVKLMRSLIVRSRRRS